MRGYADSRARPVIDQEVTAQQFSRDFGAVRNVDHDGAAALGRVLG